MKCSVVYIWQRREDALDAGSIPVATLGLQQVNSPTPPLISALENKSEWILTKNSDPKTLVGLDGVTMEDYSRG